MNSLRFLLRWSLRLLRREWRQQLGVIVLVTAGVALSVGAVVAAFNLTEPPGRSFGTGNLAADLIGDEVAAVESLHDQGHSFGVIRSVTLKATGSANLVAVRSMDPTNPVTGPLLALVDGSWPANANEIAVTNGAPTASRVVGESVELGGAERTIVGIVENPTNLSDEFVLASDIESYGVAEKLIVTRLLVDGSISDVTFPAGAVAGIESDDGPAVRTVVAVIVSLVMAVSLLIVALMSGASFAVVARRRARQYGLLAAAGATPRQVRHAVSLTGLTTGVFAAVAGALIGLAVTSIAVPRLETTVDHRIDFAVPWWSVLPTILLAIGATTLAVWWPARAVSTQSVVDVLASMRPRPSSAAGGTLFGTIGSLAGAGLVIVGIRSLSATLVIIGLCLAVVGLLLLSPGLIRLIGRRATTLPLAGRMAGRSIARQQDRSAAFISALSLALAIPVGVAMVTASLDRHNAEKAPNLPNNMTILWSGGTDSSRTVIPTERDAAAIAAAGDRLAEAAPSTSIAPVQVIIGPDEEPILMNIVGSGPTSGIRTNFSVTPVNEATCGTSCSVDTLGDRDADGNELLVTFRETWVANAALLDALDIAETTHPADQQAISRFENAMLLSHRNQTDDLAPNIGLDDGIPKHTSIASTLILPGFAESSGWETATIGWVVVADEAIDDDLLARLSKAGGQDLLIEAPVPPPSSAGVRAVAITVGLVIGLGVALAALTVLRSESAEDLRLLQAIGAGPRHHRRFSAMTAGILTGAGALIAIPVGSLAILVLLADQATDYELVIPWLSLGAILFLLPALAAGFGWLMSTTRTTNLGRRLS